MFVRLQYRKREAVRQHLTKLEEKADRDSHFGALLKIPLNQREEK